MASDKKVLCLLHLPPPMHGAAMVGKIIKDSQVINSTFDLTYINLSTSRELTEIGKHSLSKTLAFIALCFKVIKRAMFGKYDYCYLTLNSKGIGFYKDLVFVVLLKIFRRKLIFHFHNKGVANYQHKGLDNLLYKFAFHKSRVILLSPVLYSDIKKYVPENRVFYCPNGLPVTNGQISVTRNNSTTQLLFLSNMMEAKGVFDLMEACFILKARKYNFICNFVGKWSDVNEDLFYTKVKSMNIESHVRYHGAKYDDEKISYFKNADVFVHPTHNDCFPLVILEAMQYGLPVIASDEGAIPEMLDDKVTGFLIKKQNPNDLGEKLELLIKNPEKRKSMGLSAEKKFKENYTLEIFENNFCNVLMNIVKEKK